MSRCQHPILSPPPLPSPSLSTNKLDAHKYNIEISDHVSVFLGEVALGEEMLGEANGPHIHSSTAH